MASIKMYLEKIELTSTGRIYLEENSPLHRWIFLIMDITWFNNNDASLKYVSDYQLPK